MKGFSVIEKGRERTLFMAKYFEQLDLKQQLLIETHLKLVMKANETLNLTRIDNWEDGMLLHVEDSLSGLDEVNEAPDGLMGDMGSGAGFPGVPLAVATGRSTMLIDSRKKKMDAVRNMLFTLGLEEQVEVFSGRAELLARKRMGQFSVLTVRALSSLPVLLELASPLLKHGGRLVCYKSHVSDEEMNDALRVEDLVGMELVSNRDFMLGEDIYRRIIVFEKTAKPKVKLPRSEGAAQKSPL